MLIRLNWIEQDYFSPQATGIVLLRRRSDCGRSVQAGSEQPERKNRTDVTTEPAISAYALRCMGSRR